MSKNKDVRSVSFNVTKLEDRRCLDHIKGVNFSGYVKDLILADINKRNQELKIVHKSENGGIKIVIGR